jgi:predicted nucleotidyltransferase
MADLSLEGLSPEVSGGIRAFLEEVLAEYGANVHSIHIVGSALTDDFVPGRSDINSVFVLREMDLDFLETIAPKGKRHGRKRVAAPLIMTPEYIRSSADVFPIEFLSFKLIHKTVYGEDILKDIEIHPADLRRQCERELKAKLIWLRQGYMSSMGDRKVLTENLVNSIAGYIPLFRGIIMLFGKRPPVLQNEVLRAMTEAAGVDCGAFEKVLREKRERVKLSKEELETIFEDYYGATERLGKVVDEIKV